MSSQKVTYEPTPAEKKLVEVLLDPRNRMKTITDQCKLAKISRMHYYKCFKKPEFKEYYIKASKELIVQSVGPVINAFIKEAQKGAAQQGKVILEMAGLHTEKTINLNHEMTEEEADKILKEAGIEV